MAMRRITPIGGPIGRTRPGQTLRLNAALAARLVALGRARYVEPVAVPEPVPMPAKRVRRRKPDPEPEAVEAAPVAEPEPTIEAEPDPEPETTPEPGKEPEEGAENGSEDDDVRISPRTGLPVRQYRRRDMEAEDS